MGRWFESIRAHQIDSVKSCSARQVPLESRRRRCGRGVKSNHLTYVRQLQYIFDVSGGSGDSQLASGLFQLASTHHDDSNPGAINLSYAREVENDLLVGIAQETFGGPFQMFALPSQGNSPGDLEHGNVGRQMLGQDLHFPTPFLSLQCMKRRESPCRLVWTLAQAQT